MHSAKNRPFAQRLRFALAGLRHGLATERSLRLQALALACLLVLLLVIRPAPVWWAIGLLSSAVVIAAELFNTALEQLADHLHPGQHAQIRNAKDSAAAAVLVLAGGAVAVLAALLAAWLLGRPA
jgi:undecaprenol kinase